MWGGGVQCTRSKWGCNKLISGGGGYAHVVRGGGVHVISRFCGFRHYSASDSNITVLSLVRVLECSASATPHTRHAVVKQSKSNL